VTEVSDVIAGMSRAKSVTIESSREELNENSRIMFELTARFMFTGFIQRFPISSELHLSHLYKMVKDYSYGYA